MVVAAGADVRDAEPVIPETMPVMLPDADGVALADLLAEPLILAAALAAELAAAFAPELAPALALPDGHEGLVFTLTPAALQKLTAKEMVAVPNVSYLLLYTFL